MHLHEGQYAYVMAQIALLNTERAGMEAENQHRLACGHSIAYGMDAFAELLSRYEGAIGHNAIMEMVHNG